MVFAVLAYMTSHPLVRGIEELLQMDGAATGRLLLLTRPRPPSLQSLLVVSSEDLWANPQTEVKNHTSVVTFVVCAFASLC